MNLHTCNLVVWGSELSPFTLKVQRLLRQAELDFRFLPTEGSRAENISYLLRRERLIWKRLAITWPKMSEEDELPLVPFIYDANNNKTNFYDSSAFAELLDNHCVQHSSFIPNHPAANFLVKLIDEYADEYGLYMVHHNRWVVSAASNDAGKRLANEFRSLLPSAFLRRAFGNWFSKRQVRRLPYLFSVAPKHNDYSHLTKARRPPYKQGFPATHQLLEDSFSRLLQILEELLSQRAYVLGNTMTLADISLYAQLGMNVSDPDANQWMKTVAPTVHQWVLKLHQPQLIKHTSSNKAFQLDEQISPLLEEIQRTFVPLMQQNAEAVCHKHKNEKAFNRGRGLYDGTIDGVAFRSVGKTFQAKVWRSLCKQWQALPADSQQTLIKLGIDKHHYE